MSMCLCLISFSRLMIMYMCTYGTGNNREGKKIFRLLSLFFIKQMNHFIVIEENQITDVIRLDADDKEID